MVYHRSELHDGEGPGLDAVFGALAHGSRRSIVRYLASQPEAPRMSVVAKETKLSPQLLNKHSAALERAGLVSRERRGRERHLVLAPAALGEVQRWIEETRAYWEHQLDALDAYISELDDPSQSGTESEA